MRSESQKVDQANGSLLEDITKTRIFQTDPLKSCLFESAVRVLLRSKFPKEIFISPLFFLLSSHLSNHSKSLYAKETRVSIRSPLTPIRLDIQ